MTKFPLSRSEIETISEEFETASPPEIISWAVETFHPNLVMSSSFQTHSIPLLHMVRQAQPQIRVCFLETGFHFWETLIFREKLERTWGLNIVDLRPDDTWSVFLRRFGRDLPQEDPDLCCYIRKVQPMKIALQDAQAWITGIRREQTANRAKAKILERKKDGVLRIAPLLNWRKADLWAYSQNHDLPQHPLPLERYPSIGCKPCTRPIRPGEGDRAGRWDAKGKTECGLHTEMFDRPAIAPSDVAFTKKQE